MKEVTVNKAELIGILQKNMETHVTEYNELMRLFQIKAVEKVEALLEKVKAGAKGVDLSVNLREPTSNEGDYLTALEMLGMEVHDSVTISEQEFKNYVKDEWNWSRSFAMSKTAYGI